MPSDSLEAYTWLAVAAEENDRWQKAKTEAASGISGEAERDALPAVTFTPSNRFWDPSSRSPASRPVSGPREKEQGLPLIFPHKQFAPEP